MTLDDLIGSLEKSSGPDKELDALISAYDPEPLADGPYAYTATIDAAVALSERVLPGWSWRVARCCLSDDAWVMPDFNCPVHGTQLRRELDEGKDWIEVTDVDLRPSGRPAIALCMSVLLAVAALDKGLFGATERKTDEDESKWPKPAAVTAASASVPQE